MVFVFILCFKDMVKRRGTGQRLAGDRGFRPGLAQFADYISKLPVSLQVKRFGKPEISLEFFRSS